METESQTTEDFNSQSTAFLKSFTSSDPHIASFLDTHLKITDLRAQGKGRGILATQDIPADTTLFTIPRNYVICVQNSKLAQLLPSLFSDAEEVDDDDDDDEEAAAISSAPKPWLDLILVMIYEYLHRTLPTEDSHKWKDYWVILPTTFDTLMFWSDAELEELQASASRGKIGKEEANKMFRERVIPIVQKHSDVFYPGEEGYEHEGVHRDDKLTDEELLNLAHRMGSLIMAYGFDLENEYDDEDEINRRRQQQHSSENDEENDGWEIDREGKIAMGMVPMADMLNADAEFNAHLEHGEDRLTMRSLREIKAGDEVLNYYGPLANSELLRRYGYTTPKHAVFDVVEIPWWRIHQPLKENLRVDKKSDCLPDLEDDPKPDEFEDCFVIERDVTEPDETGQMSAAPQMNSLPPEMLAQTIRYASAALGVDMSRKSKDPEKSKRYVTLRSWTAISRALAALKSSYATQDWQEVGPYRTATGRLRSAMDVRMGERKLLGQAQGVTERKMHEYVDADDRLVKMYLEDPGVFALLPSTQQERVTAIGKKWAEEKAAKAREKRKGMKAEAVSLSKRVKTER